MPDPKIHIRPATESDRDFILKTAPILAGVAGLDWHSEATILKFQIAYIKEMLANPSHSAATFVAEGEGRPLGFVHVCDHQDDISKEPCGTVPLLAVLPDAERRGAGKRLIQAAENWSQKRGHRLLHLEVFAANEKALGFYKANGFKPDTLAMVKQLP